MKHVITKIKFSPERNGMQNSKKLMPLIQRSFSAETCACNRQFYLPGSDLPGMLFASGRKMVLIKNSEQVGIFRSE